ncbi:MAG: ATP-binding protein [Anaerolineae bacterium]
MVILSATEGPSANRGTTTSRLARNPLLNKFEDDLQAETILKETFSKVERAKREWESTVDALPELICIIDEHGRIIRANRTVEKWGLGNVKAIIKTNYHDLIHPHCQQPCYLSTTIQQAANQLTFVENEAYDNNLYRFISIRVQPVAMEPGTSDHHNLVVILRDISVRKRAEEALQRQNGRLVILNAINKAILAVDSPEEIAQATLKRIKAFIHYEQAHLLIKSPGTDQMLVLAASNNGHPYAPKTGQKIIETAFNQPDKQLLDKFYIVQSLGNLDRRTPFEEGLWQQGLNAYMNVPLRAGNYNIGTLQLVVKDTAVFQPEQIEVIREVAEILTIAIQQSQLHQKLSRTNDELQCILRAKHEIMQDVSHDLRSPLALIKGYTEMLKEGFIGPLTDEQKAALNIIDKKGEQLLTLVNRMFQLQTVSKDTLDKAPLNLKQQLYEVAQSWQVLTNNKNIHLHTEIEPNLPTIVADANLLDQVFTNLLDNALKFSPEDSKITIGAQTAGRNIIVSIADQGQGIVPEKATRIFDRFYQVKNSGQVKSGAGIGLALCKAIVEAHDGRIWAKSQGEGQGTTFFIALPITNNPTLSPP